jgi:signal transduction histidine kinase
VSQLLDELIAYTGLDDSDAARLRSLHPVLEPHFASVATRFYDAVWKSAGAASVLAGPEQVERLRLTLIDWMSTGLLGPYDERFYDKRSRIGRRHVVIGLAPQYMFTAMNVVRIAYHDFTFAALVPDEAVAAMRSVNKLLDIELAIMVHHYQLDSDEKLVARERRSQTEKLVAMQTMSAGLAHEVRNPLNAAKLQLELLERRLRRDTDDPRLLEPTALAQNEIERLTALLNDFLTFARPSELHPQERDVAAIVRQVVDLEHVAAVAQGKELTLAVAPPQLIARVDAPKIHQIMLNLLRNASEAVARGGHISVELHLEEGAFLIRVQDDGPGIADEVLRRIYEPFFSTKEGGTGLGMSIVHSLVVLHGGSIDIDTGARGTRFDVRLPLRA